MKAQLKQLLDQALSDLQAQGVLPEDLAPTVHIERARDKQHGDFATNLAMTLAKAARRKPRELAEQIVEALPANQLVKQVEIAGPGFINFFMSPTAFQEIAGTILDAGPAYGRGDVGNGHPIQVEFVSANPTGPLHVGHGRGAAYGAAVADLLEAIGYNVHREYYVNDAGRQMDILAVSVWLRYLERCGEPVPFPANGYRGDYIYGIAEELQRIHGDKLRHPTATLTEGLPLDEPQGGDKETYINALITRSKVLLGECQYGEVYDLALGMILENIRQDLKEFGVIYDEWFPERSLTRSGAVERAIERLKQAGHTYEENGALWFRSSDFGDEKDRVIVRENGEYTYFAADIAYHMDKMERGYDRVLDIWGADHHGYVPRVKAAVQALGDDPEKLEMLLVQFAALYRGGEKIPMSTRAGEFVTLRELREEVGNDAARFFYVMRKSDQHLDFDLDLAKSQSNDNPVYYIQYAHARVCSVMGQLKEKGLEWDEQRGRANMHLLHESHEQDLMVALSRYPEVVESAALKREPHQLAHYLRELANYFHTYYNAHTFLVESAALRDARLNLILAVRQTIKNGLTLLGVSAPESM